MAYALLGSRAEAEDVVADCWLRLAAADAREPVRDVDGWAVVAVARGAVDTLRSARVRCETYVGPWLPEPLLTAAVPDPADRVTLDESVSNGRPGLAVLDGGRLTLVVALTLDGARISRVDLVLAPAKLAACEIPGRPDGPEGG